MKISFNDWLTGTKHDDIERHLLAEKWEPRRGRMTRDSVEKRASLEYGAPHGVGAAAWNRYQEVCLPSPQPQPDDELVISPNEETTDQP